MTEHGTCVAYVYVQTNAPHPNPVSDSQKRYKNKKCGGPSKVSLLKSRFRCFCRKLGIETLTSSNIIVACVLYYIT